MCLSGRSVCVRVCLSGRSLPELCVCVCFWAGLYLHTLLAIAFVTEQKLMKWLYVIGWLVPAVFILIYALVRGMFPTETVW